MRYQDLAIDQFLERVSHMPDVEAEMELVLRKERGAAQIAMLSEELHKLEVTRNGGKGTVERRQLGLAQQAVGSDNLRINEALKNIRKRMDKVSWSNAVRAVFGQEGWEQCKEWMEANRC